MKPDQYKQEASRRHQAKLKRGGGLGTSLSSSRKQLVDQKSRRAGRKVVGDNSWRFDNSCNTVLHYIIIFRRRR